MRYLLILFFVVNVNAQTRIANVDSLTNVIVKQSDMKHEVYFYNLLDSLKRDFPKLATKVRANKAAWIDSIVTLKEHKTDTLNIKRKWRQWFKKSRFVRLNKLKRLERVGAEIWYSVFDLSLILEYHIYQKITKQSFHKLYAQKDSKRRAFKFLTKRQGGNFLTVLRSKYARFEVR